MSRGFGSHNRARHAAAREQAELEPVAVTESDPRVFSQEIKSRLLHIQRMQSRLISDAALAGVPDTELNSVLTEAVNKRVLPSVFIGMVFRGPRTPTSQFLLVDGLLYPHEISVDMVTVSPNQPKVPDITIVPDVSITNPDGSPRVTNLGFLPTYGEGLVRPDEAITLANIDRHMIIAEGPFALSPPTVSR